MPVATAFLFYVLFVCVASSPDQLLVAIAPFNASIIFGVLLINGSTISLVGNKSSSIQSVITTYFPKTSYNTMVTNTKYNIWLNSTNLSYLTITGNYVADVPIYLPHLFVLVMDNARLDAIADFTPANSTAALSSTNYALIVTQQSYYNAVVSPGTLSLNLSCPLYLYPILPML